MSKRILFFLAVLLMLLIPCISACADADYRITNYSMEISIQKDGSADVVETLIYDFDGRYNGILSLFDTDGIDGIEDFCVSIDRQPMILTDRMDYENNTYIITEEGSLAEVRIYSPGKDDVRVVTYEYTMLGLARRYEDTGMILRSLIGESNAVSLQNASIRIDFPDEADLQAFVHGGMDESSMQILESSVLFGPETVHAGEHVEIRLLFPADMIPDAPLTGELMLDAALAEEQHLIEKAHQRAVRLRNAKYLFAAVYILFFFAAWLMLAKKYGLKGQLHEPASPSRTADWPAAFAMTAVEDAPDTDALSGTLMELVQKGLVRMDAEPDDLRFTLLSSETSGLYPHQVRLLEWLFDGRDTLLLSELNAGTDYKRAQAFETGYQAYCAQVTRDMHDNALLYRNDGLRITLNALIVILGAMGAGGILLAGDMNIVLGVIVAGMLFFLLSLMSRVRRLTDDGERLQANALALKEAGISSGSDLLPLLPYYVALDMTEPLVETIDTAPNGRYAGSNDPLPFYLYVGWHHSLHSLTSSMRDTHHHNASIPNPDSASSSSHGGGGSNGGGGGHGAW